VSVRYRVTALWNVPSARWTSSPSVSAAEAPRLPW
jgi:hypothetical protein